MRIAIAAAFAACLALVPQMTAAQEVSPDLLLEEAGAYRLGLHGKPRDIDRALDLYLQAGALGENAAFYYIGAIYQQRGQIAQAIEAYERAAEAGSGAAQIALAEGHASGGFGDLSDPSKGIPALEEIAKLESGARAAYALAEFHEQGIGVAPDIETAVGLYRNLAAAGNARALRKMGRLYMSGTGVERDVGQAISLLRRSVEAGSDNARRDLANALIATGSGNEAKRVLQDAAALGVTGAAADLANGHYRELFGPASNKLMGMRDLKALAEGGDIYAIRHALIHHERKSRRVPDLDLPKVLSNLETAVEGGNRMAASSLARAYRELYWLIPGYRARHEELLQRHGQLLRPENRVSETVWDIYDANDHSTSRKKAHDYLTQLDGPGFAKGALRLRAIEKQAYVYLLQSELKQLGLYQAPVTGIAGRETVLAILSFCEQSGFYDTCIHGPLNYEASALVAEELEKRRN